MASRVYTYKEDHLITNPDLKVQTEEFVDADSMMIYQGKLFLNNEEIPYDKISLLLSSGKITYRVSCAEAIRKLNPDGGIYALVWKNYVRPANYSISFLYQPDNKKYIIQTNKTLRIN